MSIMKAQAAVFRHSGRPLTLEEVLVQDPRPGEVRVRMVASGICHTDLIMLGGYIPAPMPVILGHEGSGVIESVGAGVATLQPGDHVVLSFTSCHQCHACAEGAPAYCDLFMPLNFGCQRLDGSSSIGGDHPIHTHFFGQSSFATYAVCNAQNAVKVPVDLPLEILGPLGCGIQTGAGAVLNALAVRPGDTIAVFGTGAVGLSAVMAARLVGVSSIIAVDRNVQRLQLAAELGATHTIDATHANAPEEIRRLMPRGVDFALDTTGIPAVMEGAISALAVRGTCGLIAAVPGQDPTLVAGHIMSGGRKVQGIVEGNSVPSVFIPKLIELHRQGLFPFDRLLSFFSFEEINTAIAKTASGEVIKPIVRF